MRGLFRSVSHQSWPVPKILRHLVWKQQPVLALAQAGEPVQVRGRGLAPGAEQARAMVPGR